MDTRSLKPSRKRWWLGLLLVVLAGALIAWLIAIDFDWQSIPRALERTNTALLLSLTATLPVFGFPISLVYLSLGARFGPLGGLAVVAVITTLHLVITHWIAHSFLREPLRRWTERRGHRVPEVPEGENASVALMIMVAPGIPYFIRNYVLGMSGVPFGTYLWIALPIHLLRSYIALFLGDFGGAPSRQGLVILGLIYVVKLGIFAIIAWRLRRRHLEKKQAAETAGQTAPTGHPSK